MYLCPLGGVSSQQLEDLAAMQRSTLANLPLVGGSGQAGSQPSSKGVRYARVIGMHYTAAALLFTILFILLSFLSYLVLFVIFLCVTCLVRSYSIIWFFTEGCLMLIYYLEHFQISLVIPTT